MMANTGTACRLKKRNHSTDMMGVFSRMLDDESTKDCALMCADGQPVRAHRMILSSSSPFFRTAFDQMFKYWPNYPIIYLKDMPIIDLRAIIEFIYRGEVTVCQSQRESLIRSAQSIKVEGLEDIDQLDSGSFLKKPRLLSNASSMSEMQNGIEEIDRQSVCDSLELSDGDGTYHSMAEISSQRSGSRTDSESPYKPIVNGIHHLADLEKTITAEEVRKQTKDVNHLASTSTARRFVDIEDEDSNPIGFGETNTPEPNDFFRKRNRTKAKPSEEKVISVNSKKLPKMNVQTIDLDGSPGSPVKLKPKTIGSPVRSKANRKKLDGFACKECEDYYRSKNLTEDQLKSKLNICSRHRSKFSPPKSPQHFWETDFPSSPELIRRGCINIASNSSESSTTKTKKRK